MAVFIILWSCLFTTKFRSVIRHNLGHSKVFSIIQWCRSWVGGAVCPPSIFSRSVNPIPTGAVQIIPTYYYWPPKFFHLPASLTLYILAAPFLENGQLKKSNEVLLEFQISGWLPDIVKSSVPTRPGTNSKYIQFIKYLSVVLAKIWNIGYSKYVMAWFVAFLIFSNSKLVSIHN